MTDAPTQYLPALVASGQVTKWEREFCASLIDQTRRGRVLSEKQATILRRIVTKFQRATMRDDEAITE